jgi:hypothetical protein
MSMLDAVKDVVVGRAMRVMSDPRVSRLMGDERVMNVAMKAVGLGGSIKAELDRASRFAAGLFGGQPGDHRIQVFGCRPVTRPPVTGPT